MKRLLLLSFAALCCTLIAMAEDPVAIEVEYETGKFMYFFLDETKATATVTYGNVKYTGSIAIPSSVTVESKEYAVTCIGQRAFMSCAGLTSVSIPESVTSIESNAFYCCFGLTSVSIPESVTSIEISAFYYCTGLTSVTISNSVKRIGDAAFESTGLTSVTIPNSVTSIGAGAFRGCMKLASVTIPNSVESIEDEAFHLCANLKYVVVLATNPPTLGTDTFEGVAPAFTIYVTDKTAYNGWGGFENIKDFADYKSFAKDEIAATTQGSAYLNGLVEVYKNSIETADEFDVVSSNMDEAISKLLFARQAYQSMAKETLGTLVTEQNGPAVEVIDQNDKVVRLYNPKKVNFIKVTTEE